MKLGIKEYQIKDICHLEKGKQIDTDLLDASNEYKYINGGIDASGFYSEYNTTGQTITVSEGGASCGYVNYIEEPFWCGCHCYRLTDIKLNPKYVFYAIKANQDQIMKLRTGSAMPNIKKSSFECFRIRLSENNLEQKYVVGVLEKTCALLELKKRQVEKLDTLIKARFVELFGDILKDHYMKITDVCSIITDGTHQPPKFVQEGIPFIFVSNLVNDAITYDAEKYITQETYDELIKRTPIEIGDVLLSTVGSYGHSAVVKSDERFLFQRHIAYLKPKKALIDSEYLRGALLSSDAQRQIEEKVRGIAQKTLNLSEIKKIEIPLPPLELQRQYSAFVAQTDKSKVTIQKSLDETQLLFDSLMQEYFG